MPRKIFVSKRIRTLLIIGLAFTGSQATALDVTFKPCHIDNVESLARCTNMSVPEDWSDPGGAQINLRVVVLPPSGGQPIHNPIYLLAGGPGQAASDIGHFAEGPLSAARAGREVVLLDQRGTGQSTPFECELPDDPALSGRTAAEICLEQTQQRPEFFNSAAFIEDLDFVRSALGHDQINLVGGSYGTRAALLYVRAHGEHVRSVVLDAIAAPPTPIVLGFATHGATALDGLISICTQDQKCSAAFPKLRQNIIDVLGRLREDPIQIDPAAPNGLNEITEEIYVGALRGAMYNPAYNDLVPFVIDQSFKGNFAPLIALSDNAVADGLSIGTMLSVLCGEEMPRTTSEMITTSTKGTLFESFTIDFWQEACEVWPHQIVDKGYWDPVVSDIPMLLLSGALDPVTPPSNGEEALASLSNARHFVAPLSAHITSAHRCAPKLISELIDSLDVDALDGSCFDEKLKYNFVLSNAGPNP